MALGLVPVIAAARGDGLEGDEQVPLTRSPGGEPPGAVPAGRAGLVRHGEAERRATAGRTGAACGAGFMPLRGVCPAAGGCRTGAAMPDGVPVLVSSGSLASHQVDRAVRAAAAARSRARSGSRGPMPGISPGRSARPSRVTQGDGEVERPGEPGRDHPGQRPGQAPASRAPATRPAIRTGAAVRAGAAVVAGLGVVAGVAVFARSAVLGAGLLLVRVPQRAGVDAEQDVQEGAGPEQVHAAVQARLAQLPGPPGDPLISGQHLGRRQLPAGQARVPGRLGPPLHPRLLRPMLPALASPSPGSPP